VDITAAEADRYTAADAAGQAELARAQAHVQALRQHTGRTQALHLHLPQVLPAHAGLGSGTQLALAVGRAFAAWQGLQVPTPTLASWLGRGLRSGIGIAGFDHGGLLLDGGPGRHGSPAPLLTRLALPEDWRVIVVADPRQQGLSGAAEQAALGMLPPLPQGAAAEVCHRVVMQVLPGAADADFPLFAHGLTRLQQVLGEHFAPAQGGSAYASPAVARAMHWLAEAGGADGAATGQSSWGPTAFAIVPTPDAAQALVAALQAAGAADPALVLRIVRGRNHGAQVDVTTTPPPVRS